MADYWKGVICLLFLLSAGAFVQGYAQTVWDSSGQYYFEIEDGGIVQGAMPSRETAVWLSRADLQQANGGEVLQFSRFSLDDDGDHVLLFGDNRRVYHNTYNTCWVYDRSSGRLVQVGEQWGTAQLLNASLSPDGTQVAYVYDSNIYIEDLERGETRQLTHDGQHDSIRNGWFDYVTSEELFLTQGLQWSPDSKRIAFWRMDISDVPIFYMVNNTDSVYPQLVPIPFSKPGEPIAKAKIGVVTVADGQTTWVDLPNDTSADYYIPKIGWNPDGQRLMVQHLTRRQDVSTLFCFDVESRAINKIYEDRDEAWVDIQAFWMRRGHDWYWVDGGDAFIWASEKSGWRKLYRIGMDGQEQLLTTGDFDVMRISAIDAENGLLYFMASPDNATQSYLYQVDMKKPSPGTRVTPEVFEGTNGYNFSPDGKWAQHSFSSHRYLPVSEWLAMPGHQAVDGPSAADQLKENPRADQISFFTITTDEGVEMDGWMVKPKDFDPNKKYPAIFSVYSEPAGATVTDAASVGGSGRGSNFFDVDSGYLFLSVEGRGTPVAKGRAWRKAIYGKLGQVNVIDQAGAVKKIREWSFIDTNRIAVFGGSGGGSTTLHLLFRYPELYKTGMASAGVPSHFVYNSTYQERYLGLLPESRDNYVQGSAITYAKHLQGNLLIVHGTGDHNVHYQGEELLLNELIKYNKQFQFIPYPNRGHGISEGEGTVQHRKTLYHNFLSRYCPPGGI